MTTNTNDEATFRQALLTSPGERQAVEYKSAVPFDDNTDFGLKLVKHILGMANTGGGWIVIGYDDVSLRPDLNHSAEIAATYDTTRLSDVVNRYVERGQSVRLSVFKETHPETQLIHPEVRVDGFERIPFICRSTKAASDTGEQVLQSGKVYIRRPGAATSDVRTSSDWDDLLKRGVSQRRDEFLQEFADLFRRMTSGDATPPEDVMIKLNRWIGERWDDSSIQELLGDEGVYMESAQMLVQPRGSEWTHQELRRAAASAMWFHQNELITPREEGIEVLIKPPDYPQYWYLGKTGNCYCSRSLFENHERLDARSERSLRIDVSIHRIALAFRQSADLYRELNVSPDEPYLFSLKHGGLKVRALHVTRPDIFWPRYPATSQEDSHLWQREITQDLVRSQLIELTHQVANGLSALFNFTEVPMGVVRTVLAESRTDRGEPLIP